MLERRGMRRHRRDGEGGAQDGFKPSNRGGTPNWGYLQLPGKKGKNISDNNSGKLKKGGKEEARYGRWSALRTFTVGGKNQLKKGVER